MQLLRVQPSKLSGEITAPPSKSYTHRAFAIALLAEGKSRIKNPLLGHDTMATIEAARILGAKIARKGDIWEVTGVGRKISPTLEEIDAKNSGTTMRLFSAISALSPKPIKIIGDSSLLKRPMGPLIDALAKLGARGKCHGREGRPPVVVGGPLEGGEVEITGKISSQFISALLIAAPLTPNGVEIRITEELRSKPYVEITLELLEKAGAKIKRDSSLMNFKIPGNQSLRPLDITIPGDFSSAAFTLGAAAITDSRVKVKNLDLRTAQGDKRIVDYLEKFGAELSISKESVEVLGGAGLCGIDLDCADTPDLVPVLSVVGCVAEGSTTIFNVPHLRLKESDRLKVLSLGLSRLGADVGEMEDGLRIKGGKKLRGNRVSSYGDHRMAMAFGIAGLVAEGETLVDGAESIPVSYPSFVEDMRKLGARMVVEEVSPPSYRKGEKG
ncbi:MAG: 3-phosphoshikimate 1-carboxyvinyltransferase [Candidatus Hadarchaeales archaeon]